MKPFSISHCASLPSIKQYPFLQFASPNCVYVQSCRVGLQLWAWSACKGSFVGPEHVSPSPLWPPLEDSVLVPCIYTAHCEGNLKRYCEGPNEADTTGTVASVWFFSATAELQYDLTGAGSPESFETERRFLLYYAYVTEL